VYAHRRASNSDTLLRPPNEHSLVRLLTVLVEKSPVVKSNYNISQLGSFESVSMTTSCPSIVDSFLHDSGTDSLACSCIQQPFSMQHPSQVSSSFAFNAVSARVRWRRTLTAWWAKQNIRPSYRHSISGPEPTPEQLCVNIACALPPDYFERPPAYDSLGDNYSYYPPDRTINPRRYSSEPSLSPASLFDWAAYFNSMSLERPSPSPSSASQPTSSRLTHPFEIFQLVHSRE